MHTRICTHTHVQIMVKFEDDLNAEGITEQRKVSARYVIPVPAVTAAAATGSYTNGSSGVLAVRGPHQCSSSCLRPAATAATTAAPTGSTRTQQVCIPHKYMQLLLLSRHRSLSSTSCASAAHTRNTLTRTLYVLLQRLLCCAYDTTGPRRPKRARQ